jgi:hypothetical protein
MATPALAGNGRHEWVRATTAPTLPVTITAASNDQFEFNELEYIVPAGVYSTIQALAAAVQAAVADEDNVTTPLFSSVCLVEVSRSDPTKLKFTSVAPGNLGLTLGTGVEHDALASLIVADATTLAGGDPVD